MPDDRILGVIQHVTDIIKEISLVTVCRFENLEFKFSLDINDFS